MTAPALADLDAFAAVARHRSFRRAARERGVSPSLLSQTVRRLEATLGVALLVRTTRSVAPTQAGELLLAGLEPALAGVADALERLNGLRDRPSGRLRINAPVPVAHLFLAPLAGDFLREHPDVELEICADDTMRDVLGAGFDAGVRYGEDLALDMVAVPLAGPRLRVVAASPAYLAEAGVPRHPRDLPGHRLIAHRFADGSLYRWEFARDGETLTVMPSGGLIGNEPVVELQAALDGCGLAWLFADYARPYVEAGRLVTVLDEWQAPLSPPCLYFPRRRYTPAPLRAFIDFLRRRAGGGDAGNIPG